MLVNEQKNYDRWSKVLRESAGIKDERKLRWMSKYANNHQIFEADNRSIMNESYLSADLGNVSGMGAVGAPTGSATQAAFYTKSNAGSGDKFPTLLPLAIKVAASTVGFDIVPVIPMQGPTGVLPYIDYEYAGGKLDSSDNPYVIKINSAKINNASSAHDWVQGDVYWGVSELATAAVADGSKGLKMQYVGQSRIDGFPIFKILGGYDLAESTGVTVTANEGVTVAVVFDGNAAIVKDDTDKPTNTLNTTTNGVVVTATAELVRALEDHITGFAGAGDYDSEDWGSSASTDSNVGPMSRATGETTYFRAMGLKTYTKIVEAKTYQASIAVTTEQIQDLNRQFGLDVPSMLEATLINEISQGINAHILDRAFKLGWSNHHNIYNTQAISLNLNLTVGDTGASASEYVGMAGSSKLSIGMPDFANFGNYENLTSLQRRIKSRLLGAANVIANRGRRGAANFVVTNLQMATALQDSANYTIAPMENTISQNSGSLYPLGTVAGMTIYVDPRMSLSDNRMLVGRRGDDGEPGLKFMPYIMAEVISTIAEGTMSPKTAIKSRYALVESGHFPETMYLTLDIKSDGTLF